MLKERTFLQVVGEKDNDLALLLHEVSIAAKLLSHELRRTALTGMAGAAGTSNTHGERQHLLDVYANELFISALTRSGRCRMVISEESSDPVTMPAPKSKGAGYIIAIDPLDGSAGIDSNVTPGTIFSVYQCLVPQPGGTSRHALYPGSAQVAAGYFLYGAATMVICTTGDGVNGFTLDPVVGEFILTHPSIKIPRDGHIYSVNEGHSRDFPPNVRELARYCREQAESEGRPFALRYIGSMAADIHRILFEGGIFMYPPTRNAPQGKLRLLYECSPMALIIEQAGGKAIDGTHNILELPVAEPHQRSPIYIGSANLVSIAERLIRNESMTVEIQEQ